MRADLDAMVNLARSATPAALDGPGHPRTGIADAHTRIEYTKLLNYRALSKILRKREELARGPAGQAPVVLPGPDPGRAGRRPARARWRLAKGGPDAVDGGPWNRLYVFQRYTSIGAGTTEVQKNIIADKAIKMPRR